MYVPLKYAHLYFKAFQTQQLKKDTANFCLGKSVEYFDSHPTMKDIRVNCPNHSQVATGFH